MLSVVSFGGRLYTSGDDMTLRVWDLATGELVQTWGPFETETDSCAVDPIRRRAVLGCDDGCLRVFDLDSGALVAEIEAHSSGIKKVAVSPVTGDLLSAAYDQRILIWDAADLQQKASARIAAGDLGAVVQLVAGRGSVLAGTFDGTVLEWDATTGKVPARGRRHRGQCLFERGRRRRSRRSRRGERRRPGAAGPVVASPNRNGPRAIEPQTGRILMNAVTFDPGTGSGRVRGPRSHAPPVRQGRREAVPRASHRARRGPDQLDSRCPPRGLRRAGIRRLLQRRDRAGRSRRRSPCQDPSPRGGGQGTADPSQPAAGCQLQRRRRLDLVDARRPVARPLPGPHGHRGRRGHRPRRHTPGERLSRLHAQGLSPRRRPDANTRSRWAAVRPNRCVSSTNTRSSSATTGAS